MKYPRTKHLPWSPGGTNDDKRMTDVEPNAFFPTRGRYESRRRTTPRGSKSHIKGGCGVEVRLVDDPKK